MNITKALVVDDSKVAHLTLRKMLMERNIEVDWVGSGEESIAYLKKQKPDVVFMDVMMPGMDGFETLRAINQSGDIERPVIVMCSANATNEDKNIASENGAIDFLSKPYTSHELDAILQHVTSSISVAMTGAPAETPELTPEEPTLAIPESPPQPTAPAPATDSVPVTPVSADTGGNVEEIARAAAEAVARKTAEVTLHAARTTSRSIAEEAARKVVQEMLQDHTPAAASADIDVAALRRELEQQLSQQIQTGIQQQLSNAVAEALQGDSVQQQLGTLVSQQVAPLEAKAREAASRSVQERLAAQGSDDTAAAALKRAGSAMSWAILALLISLGAIGIIVASFMGLI